jgi:hypothetical protein
MCKTCGLVVNGLGMNRGRIYTYSQAPLAKQLATGNKAGLFQTLHNFYTHFFTYINLFFQSVISGFYTLYTRLIITKTMYI